MSSILGFRTTRRAPTRKAPAVKFSRLRLEGMESRDVPAAMGPALLGAPLINGVSLTGITAGATNAADEVLQLVGNLTTPGGQTVQVPLTLTNTTPGASTPILDLHVNPIDLNVLGLKVDTSQICLDITAQSGPGKLLGNLLTDVSHLLDQGLNIGQILSNLSLTQLNTLSTGLSGVLNGALAAIGSPTNAATGGATVDTSGATPVLDLSLGPVNLNLLGLQVHLDNCAGGPVTVDISAQPGAGNLLGNLVSGLANLLNTNAPLGAVRSQINKIATDIKQLASAAAHRLNSLLPLNVTGVTITDGSNGTLDLTATATTPTGQSVSIPLVLTNTTPNSTTPILNLHIDPIHLNALGLTVDTSPICLDISAQSGSGNLLGNLLADIAGLLDQNNGGQVAGSLTGDQLTTLSTGLSGLLNGALAAIGSPTNAATGGAAVDTSGTTPILNLSLGPVDLDLLGLLVHLDNCSNGPITVAIGAQTGPGKLLGNLVSGLAHLLDTNAATAALLQQINRIAGDIGRLL